MKITLPSRKLEKSGIFHVELFSVFPVFWDFFNSVLRHQKVQRSRINSFWIFFQRKIIYMRSFFPTFSPETHKICNWHFFRKKVKILKNYFFWKKKFLNQKVPKTYFFMKRKLPKQSTWKNFFSNKVYWKNSFRKKHFEVKFFYKQYITKKLHKNFSKKLKKKILAVSFQFLKY